MLSKVIKFLYYILFFFTPLLWQSSSYELFEFNKMMLTYLLTILITGAWICKSIRQKKLLIKTSPLDIPLLVFLLSQIISTMLSIDQHTSVWGYYSRSNGGLLSIICYTLLYFAFTANFSKEDIPVILKSVLFGGLVVALYAIPEHFGVSPSCIILRGQLNASCWMQQVQDRVFATLGQPNWLAAYLAMLIFPAIYFFLQAKTTLPRLGYFLLIICIYLAFTFTFSRGATLGMITGLSVFIVFVILSYSVKTFRSVVNIRTWQLTLAVLVGLLTVNLLFGSSLNQFKLIKKAAPPPRPAITTAAVSPPATGTQLESGGTESGQIRLIVWQGAWDIFKHYPIFGSGVETFAYSYYQFRPRQHNLVSEWDFLYNKAHNEYLNYLATTGLVGFLSYSLLIITFLVWSTKQIMNSKQSTDHYLLQTALLSGYISYLVQNFFGFSVVAIALFFYLFPAIAVVLQNKTAELNFGRLSQIKTFFRYTQVRIVSFTLLGLIVTFLLAGLFLFWIADSLFALGENYSEAGLPNRAYKYLSQAVAIWPNEPFYRNEMGFAAGSLALVLQEKDATLSAYFKDKALTQTALSLKTSPSNVSFYRTALRTFYALASLDPSLNDLVVKTADQAIQLAPTDAKLYYNKALIIGQLGKIEEATRSLHKAIELRPIYKEAYLALAEIYHKIGQTDQAKSQLNQILKFLPGDQETADKLKELDAPKKDP